MNSRARLILVVGFPLVAQIGIARVFGEEPNGDAAGRIEAGFRRMDAKPLDSFLADWHAASTPESKNTLGRKPAFERAVYELYSQFYVPDESAKRAKYIVIPGSLDVAIFDRQLPDDFHKRTRWDILKPTAISELTVRDFRPVIPGEQDRILYMDESRFDTLNRFVTGDDRGIVLPSNEKGSLFSEFKTHSDRVRALRVFFMKGRLDTLPYMSARSWRVETEPLVLQITLNVSLQQAIIVYSESYALMAALAEKTDSGWRIIERKTLFVE